MTGLDVAAELKRRKTGTRVIILTTFARAGYLRRALEAGASGYLLKDMAGRGAGRRGPGGWQRGLRVIDPELATEGLGDEADPLTDPRTPSSSASRRGTKAVVRLPLGWVCRRGTVRNYLSEAISKLGASNRVEAARTGAHERVVCDRLGRHRLGMVSPVRERLSLVGHRFLLRSLDDLGGFK